MKVTPANTSLFGEDARVVKGYFESFAEFLAEKFEVQSEMFATYLGTFELFLMTREGGEDLSFLEVAVNALVEWFGELDKLVARAIFIKAEEGCREGNDSFWSMLNSDPRIRNDYSFKENVDKQFEVIGKVLEFMVAREGWLIAAFQRNHFDVEKDIPLHLLWDGCRSFFGEDGNLAVVGENLFGVPLNQWRNIAAHKSYKCLGGKIEASYGRDVVKVVTLSGDELGRACMEIYKFRIGIKLVTGLALTIVAARGQDLAEAVQLSPRSFLHDLNYLLGRYGAQVETFELLSELVVNGEKFEVPDDFSIFDVKFACDDAGGSDDARLPNMAVRIAKVLSYIFGDHNNLPGKERILLHFSRSPDNGFHMIYTYD
ncbi:hypothetical protein HU749_004980 [Pseudomonas ogarae]|uniref:hypothetical protein n=1 Tax=Pseudomonas ogarae (strain DSM 112162 / CECT 30235 / F113) TaxID=1114970 RepID=UPI0016482D8A|nr:hypothetical protein [Pseudomonas zarinae]QXH95744.1 hypothetical protein HU749_004980 [Pseudomonas zarinae]